MTQLTNTHRGFTIIELMLAMTFVSVLLLTIAMTVIQMGTIYNRGMTLKEVNQSARDLADDLRRSVQSSGQFTLDVNGADTANYVQTRGGAGVVESGRLCLGNYSYLWNTGVALEANGDNLIRTISTSGAVGGTVNFVRVPDSGKKYCTKDSKGALLQKNIENTDTASMTELLKPGDRTISILSFKVTTTANSIDELSKQQLYNVSYTLGTGSTSAMQKTDNVPTACLPPGDANANPVYCNVQQFGIVLRAGNTVN